MNITYDESTRTFKLDTPKTSYLFQILGEEGFVGHVYYGARIEDTDLSYLLCVGPEPFAPSHTDRERASYMDKFLSEFPGHGLGDYRESCLNVRDEDGHEAVQLLYRGHRILKGKPALKNGFPATFAGEEEALTLELILEDSVLGLTCHAFYTVFADTDAITFSRYFKNESDRKLIIKKADSLSIDLWQEDYELLTLHGSWARERSIDRRPIGYGKTSVGSFRGESSHQEHPFLALVSGKATQETGNVLGVNFIWSGNFLAQVEKTQFDLLRVQMGIHPDQFSYVLAPGEEFQAPEAVSVFSAEGLGHMTRSFHDLYRNHLIRSPYKNKKRPILINNWEATYFDFHTEKLLSIAREAKKVGIEMLVMDDGWFGHRNDDNSSLGDWTVNEEKLPGGLKYLVDEVNKIGLKFGIWMEPEMISPDSDLYRAHPDWAIQVPDRIPTRSRNQLVLDLSRQEVVDHVFEMVANVLRSANIEYLKWDMNRQLTDLGSIGLSSEHQGELCYRYVMGVYQLQGRLVKEFPNLLLENCSGGGARFDPGMLYFGPQIWTSDDTDAIERLGIQEGTALVYPLSSMGAHVSDCPNHTVGRITPFRTRGHVALAGTFGYELDITKIPEEDRAMIPAQVEMYHKYNDLMRCGDYYRIASFRENHYYDCYEVVAKDKTEALVTYVQVLRRPNQHGRVLRIPGLDPERKYLVTFDDMEKKDLHLTGGALANAGIWMEEQWGDYRSVLIHITAE
ncbi:MAG: alpha-galactosidase [Lachnospiraceae bacterium]|nr:alpha-galactosidase [Lachnospiraceae bacterium]